VGEVHLLNFLYTTASLAHQGLLVSHALSILVSERIGPRSPPVQCEAAQGKKSRLVADNVA